MDIGFLTRDGRRPFVLGADFNATPHAWEGTASSWLKRLNAHLVTAGSAITCKCGEGSTIDYFMISNSLRSFVESCEVDQDVPWGPHYAVWLCRAAARMRQCAVLLAVTTPEAEGLSVATSDAGGVSRKPEVADGDVVMMSKCIVFVPESGPVL